MRAVVLLPVLLGCGAVRLGDEPVEPVEPPPDAATVSPPDAGQPPSVSVSVRALENCPRCFELLAEARGGQPPYAVEWEDGSREAARRVCPEGVPRSVTVTAQDANARRSAPHVTNLEPGDVACAPDAAMAELCLSNLSFEGTATATGAFDAAPWDACTNPSRSNMPRVLNETIEQPVAILPRPTDGATYLGLLEKQQVSQRLCEQVSAGSTLSIMVDLSRLNVTAGVVPDTEQAYLEIWGGFWQNCSSLELLWASPLLELKWQTFCVTLRPQYLMDNLTLRARTDDSQLTAAYLLVDNIVRVSACPKP